MIRALAAWTLILSWAIGTQHCSAEGAAMSYDRAALSADIIPSPPSPSPPAVPLNPSTMPGISLYHVAFASLAVLIHSGKIKRVHNMGLCNDDINHLALSLSIRCFPLLFSGHARHVACIHRKVGSVALYFCDLFIIHHS